MKELLLNKLKESFSSVLPIIIVVLLICIFKGESTTINLMPAFLIGGFLLVLGMCIFDIGANLSMVNIGSQIGMHLTKKKNVFLLLFMCFLIATIITIAEPDLLVLSKQTPNISPVVLIGSVGIGVGLFFLIACIRLLKRWSYNLILILTCILMFVIAIFVPKEFIGVAFDSGGVTTGALSVPFIISLARGLTSFRVDKERKNDTFGLMAFCSLGPIVVLLLLGLIYKSSTTYEQFEIMTNSSISEVILNFIREIPTYLKEVGLSLSPILVLFVIYDIFFIKLKKKPLIKIIKGLIYTYIGLVIFMLGVNVGFLPMSYMIGKVLANDSVLLIPISALIGFFIIYSEPAIKVLLDQIEDITNGTINKQILLFSLSLGVSIATLLSITRIIMGFSLMYILIPGYLIAILLSFFAPNVFTRIAFDSGGVASGTMTASFLLPFAIGISEFLNRDILLYSFGLVATVATIPLITVEIIGIIYKIKTNKKVKVQIYNAEIIDYY